MRTPDGRECKYYYLQANPRYREIEECRIPKSSDSAEWQPSICAICPVPDILRANASPFLEFVMTIKKPRFFGRTKVLIHASCKKHEIPISDPFVGCPQCRNERSDALDLFAQALENGEPPDD